MQDFYPYNEMLAGAKRRRPEFGTIPIEPLKKFVYGRILVVGDAAGQATPWYCEGIRPALESSEICAKAIVKAYENSKFNVKALERYQHLWDAKNRKMYSRFRAWSYFRSQQEWDNSIRYQASLTPDEMISEIRYFNVSSFRSKIFFRDWWARFPMKFLKRWFAAYSTR